MKYTMENFLLDVNSGIEIRPWQAVMVEITGKGEEKEKVNPNAKISRLYSGFRFADGGCCDSRGNFYFLDSMDKKIYRIDAATLKMSMIFESPYKINSIGFDTRDNIIVVGEYAIPKDATLNARPNRNVLPPDSAGTSYGYWYNSQAQIVAFTIDRNREIEKLQKINIGDLKPARVLYPGNRWRDGSDFQKVVRYNPQKAFLAPDGVTIIPCHYDLIRANNLSRSKPGRKLYSVDEMYKRVYQCEVTEEGLLTNPIPIIEEGDYRVRKFNEKIYVGDCDIKVYENNRLTKVISIPERPLTFDFGGTKGNTLFVTTTNSVYMVKE
jgi:sugar lactone lactonase YvrE